MGNNDGNDFEKPSKEDLGGAAPKPWKHIVDYAAGKTPEQFVTDGLMANLLEKGKLGFSFWDKKLDTDVRFTDLMFYHLATFWQIRGEVFDAGGKKTVEYWSNYVLDSRTEEFTVYSSGQRGPIAKGLYEEIRKRLPKGAERTVLMAIYEPFHDEIMLLPLPYLLSQGIKASMAGAYDTSPSKISLFGIPEDSFWGFRHKGYGQVSKSAEQYAGKGDMFFMPMFYSGVIREEVLRTLLAQKKAEVAEWYASNRRKPQAAEKAPEKETPPVDDLPY